MESASGCHQLIFGSANSISVNVPLDFRQCAFERNKADIVVRRTTVAQFSELLNDHAMLTGFCFLDEFCNGDVAIMFKSLVKCLAYEPCRACLNLASSEVRNLVYTYCKKFLVASVLFYDKR